MSIFLKAALEYEAIGFSVIPVVPGQKKPLIDWKEFQTRKATPAEIVEWWSKTPNANVGLVTGAISNLSVVDLDRYKENFNPDNELLYFENTGDTPVAITPRKGNHLYYQDCGLSGGADLLPGIDLRCKGNFIVAPPSMNGEGNAYTWSNCDCKNLREALARSVVPEKFIAYINNNILYNKGIQNATKFPESIDDKLRQYTTNTTECDNLYSHGRRDEDLFHLANTLVKSRIELPFIYQTLKIIALNATPPYPLNEVHAKIQSALDRTDKRDKKLIDEVREVVMGTTGDFSATSVDIMLNLTTSVDKKHVCKILHRLCTVDKIIEKVGSKNGVYRLIDEDSPVINIKDADMHELDIKFPLGVHEKVLIHKSNIIIIAGESNSGKTAFCLNAAELNMPNWEINYLSSEMQDGTELAIRLREFGKPFDYWDKVNFRFRTDNFPDVIKPDAINIIDYLDEGKDEIYKMTNRIKAIGHKLRNGVALICIQKHSKKDYGFGGESTKNAARLYMTITGQNRLTIEKGKIWRSHIDNPNGQYIDFKLVAGCKFSKEDRDGKRTKWIDPRKKE